MRVFTLASVAASLACLASPTAAQEQDFNIWLTQVASIEAEEDVTIRLEAQERFFEDASRLGQLLLRPAIGYQISEDVSVFAGYAYVFTNPEGPAESNEHRIFQELNLRIINLDDLTISSRNRLEQRFFEEVDGTGWRYRNQIQVRAPINQNNSLIVYTEPFIELNDGGPQSGGVALWRNFVGVSIPLSEQFSLTPGYLNQTVFRDGPDLSQHIVNVSVSARF
ncbi:MAG: DUF2490 domain-containing protein [Erythrobacter sp.]